MSAPPDSTPSSAARVAAALALAAATLLAACGADPRDVPRDLESLLDAAVLRAPDDGQEGVEVLELARGRAWVELVLDGRRAVRERRGEAIFERLEIPFPALAGRRLDTRPATVELPDGRRSAIDGERSWLGRRELVRRVRRDTDGPEVLRLRYPTSAAHLAAAGLLDGLAPGEVLLDREYDGRRSERVLRLPRGIELALPAIPDGRLIARVLGPDGAALEARDVDGLRIRSHPAGAVVELPLDRPLRLTPRGGDLKLAAPRLAGGRAASAAPSVLVLILDTLRADRVGPWREGPTLTPHLDALLAESVLWERAWSTTSWTLPSIATLLTGRQAAEHGAYHSRSTLHRDVPTLAELFEARGRRTAAFTEGGYFLPAFGLDRGFGHFDGSFRGLESSVPELLAWLDRRPGDPFMAVLHTYAVHEPYEPRDPAAATILADLDEAESALAVRPSLAVDPSTGDAPTRLSDELVGAMAALYDLEVRELDAALGALLGTLRARGLFDDLLIAVVADHGEEFGERGLAGHGDTLFPEQLHVPLALRRPGDRDGRRVAEPVSTVDFAATLLDAAGLDGAAAEIGGTSLFGSRTPSETFAWRQPHGDRGPMRAVRADGWLLTEGEFRFPRAGVAPEGLYDLRRDPTARRDPSTLDAERAADAERQLRALFERFPDPPPVESVPVSSELEAQLEALGYR